MATTTAIILIGKAHQNSSGINPTHLIRLSENDRPALILQTLEGNEKSIVIVPTLENIVDDIYLMIAVFILNGIKPTKNINNNKRISIDEILDNSERRSLYTESKKLIEKIEIKVVFNILDGSHLLNHIDIIKSYPKDIEITISTFKKEFNAWESK